MYLKISINLGSALTGVPSHSLYRYRLFKPRSCLECAHHPPSSALYWPHPKTVSSSRSPGLILSSTTKPTPLVKRRRSSVSVTTLLFPSLAPSSLPNLILSTTHACESSSSVAENLTVVIEGMATVGESVRVSSQAHGSATIPRATGYILVSAVNL